MSRHCSAENCGTEKKAKVRQKMRMKRTILNPLRSKKGQGSTNWYIIFAVMFLASIVVIAWMFLGTQKKAESMFEDTQCSASILYASALKLATKSTFESEIRCETKFVKVNSAKQGVTNHYIAESLRGCWKTWQRGELKLFDEDGIYCHVCSVIELQPETGNIENFDDYLATTTMQGTSVTYAGYLLGYESEESEYAPAIETYKQPAFPRNTAYATVFAYAKGSNKMKELQDKLAVLGGSMALEGAGAFLFVKAVAIGVGTVVGGTVGIIGIGIAAVGVTAYALIAGTDVFDAPAGWRSMVMFIPYTPEAVQAVGCEYTAAGSPD